jgi:hypothetical protein
LPGSQRSFKVCGNASCTSFKTVTAIARAVGRHIAIYVDTLAPSGGLDSADIDSLKTDFDTRLYEVDTTAFGRESDIDNNGVVIVLMTPAVNQLVTASECVQTGYIVGYFFAADLDPRFASTYNHGEIYYTIVADAAGTLSCAHSRAAVMLAVRPTFMHEFEHMINYVQHVVVRGGLPEETWLDEALAKRAEELGGESYLPDDSATYMHYVAGDLDDAYQYLEAPGDHFLVTTTDRSLQDVGAGWLFMRYLSDQYGDGVMQALVQSSMRGAANVVAATGQDFPTLVARWGLANWVSDLPGFAAAPELKYTSWAFRSTYQALHEQDPGHYPRPFPLVLASGAPDQLNLAGFLRAGSATYYRMLQAPAAPAVTLQFVSDSTMPLPAAIVPRLPIIRVR